MLVYIGSNHYIYFLTEIYNSLLRYYDRGWSRNRRKTRKLIQEDYEDINSGNTFGIEYRYANLLFVLGVTFLYSSGMPILYPIAAAFFIVSYWVDKILLIHFNRKPIQLDSYVPKRTLEWYKFILLMHVVSGTLMYANSNIVPSKDIWIKNIN